MEYVELGELLEYIQPNKYIVNNTDYSNDYDIPVLTAGQTFILGYTNEKDNIYKASKENPSIIFDDFTASFHWVDFNFKVKSSAIKMLIPKKNKNVNFRYIYHFMKKLNYSSDKHLRLWISVYSKFKIPLPPLEKQQKIADLLDRYENANNELIDNLNKEYELRRKQYEYYRDEFLTFGDDVEIKELNDVLISIKTGLNPRKFFKLNTDDATNYYVTIREIKNGNLVFSDKTDKINNEALKLCNNRSNLEIGDVLFSATGTIGQTYVINEEVKNWNIKEGIYSLKPNRNLINSKYLSYILNVGYIKESYMKKIVGGTVSSIPMNELTKLKIPLPSIEKQREIVSTLEKYESMYNEVRKNVLAEIEMREKQYSYYLDKVFNFE